MTTPDIQATLVLLIEKLANDPPPDVLERMQKRLEESRKGMPKGASMAVLNLRMGN